MFLIKNSEQNKLFLINNFQENVNFKKIFYQVKILKILIMQNHLIKEK